MSNPPIPGVLGNSSINPASGYFSNSWPASGAIPQSFSAGGWTLYSRGIKQQTFLGASIRSFSMNGGFGDNSSNLSVELVNDEYNVSDQTAAGLGDDIYHSGNLTPLRGDNFNPPPVGSPVYFKFGENFATIEEAYKQTYDDLNEILYTPPIFPTGGGTYDINNFRSLPNNSYVNLENNEIVDLSSYLNDSNFKGRNHLVFGGILQSYVQNRGPGGNPLYSVQVIDPREILSNVTLILNNYAGTTYNNNNLLNIYGFLEYNPSQTTRDLIKNNLTFESILKKTVVIANQNVSGVLYSGDDTRKKQADISRLPPPRNATSIPNEFPLTGTGFSRRSDAGIPYYRVKQAVNALMGYNGALPKEYIDQGFGGKINFRGFNYVVDFGTLPDLPGLYYLDFDEINLLDLCLEICDVVSRDLFVTLLPVIDHPRCDFFNAWNNALTTPQAFAASGIAGIIRIDSIDRSTQPEYGSIKKYIDSLATSGIFTENQDLGFELSNITTDKFIVGAQEVENYFFTTLFDRDTNDALLRLGGSSSAARLSRADKWKLETSFNQQLLPYYGLLGERAVTIPKGFGAYQQILLDTTGLNANGVGAYYVTTEMELRCALISFDRWKEFLMQYNDIYMESVELNDTAEAAGLRLAVAPANNPPPPQRLSNNYAVTVPRSIFETFALECYSDDNLPKSPCNPPYGYPLYYKRATKIGLPEGGLTQISSRLSYLVSNYNLLASADQSNYRAILLSEWSRLAEASDLGELSAFEKTYLNQITNALENPNDDENIEQAVLLLEEFLDKTKEIFNILPKIAKKNNENAMKVYEFVRKVAEECMGKKFLIKIPKSTNLFYNLDVVMNGQEYSSGPFGFKPRPNNAIPNYENSGQFLTDITNKRVNFKRAATQTNLADLQACLNSGVPEFFQGSLKVNYNPIASKHEFNYTPVNDGGFFDFDLYSNLLSTSTVLQLKGSGYRYLPSGVQRALIPIDLTNFINNGRINPYVRFNHSQHLSFENLRSEDFVIEEKTVNGRIPNLAEDLDNIKGNVEFSFEDLLNRDEDNYRENPPEQIAFVKCQVDEKLYMSPKVLNKTLHVHARTVKEKRLNQKPRKIYDPCKDEYLDSFSFYKSHFVPEKTVSTQGVDVSGIHIGDGGSYSVLGFRAKKDEDVLKSFIIATSDLDLDTNNVYALITLPGMIIPTKDARFRDGLLKVNNAPEYYHYMTMDTVDKEVPGFDSPAILGQPTKLIENLDCGTLSAQNRNLAWFTARKAQKGLSFSFPNQIKFTMPSPVYPDLICLPLMSHERCYGPWISSQLDFGASVYSNIGGKIEYIKDEHLAPWNYDGYGLMNDAGTLQCQFAQSLLLSSERGGFVVPGVPPKVSLGKSLLTLGPLVTNLQVDVSEAGIRTTVKMDLYTASFGKLQKQKQDLISKLSRERQKLKDEKNALIRKGLGKSQTSRNYGQEIEQINNQIQTGGIRQIPQGISPINNIALSVQPFAAKRWSSEISANNGQVDTIEYQYGGSFQNNKTIGLVAQEFISERDLAREYYNSSISSISDVFAPASMLPNHGNMSSRQLAYNKQRMELYYNQDSTFQPTEITSYRRDV